MYLIKTIRTLILILFLTTLIKAQDNNTFDALQYNNSISISDSSDKIIAAQ